MEDAGAGALLGTLLGDCLGADAEGARPTSLPEAEQRVAAVAARGRLRHTDDAQLTMALAEHLLERPDVDPEALRERFLSEIEPWRGYGGGMLRLVELWRQDVPTERAATAVFPEGSFGNGAAMRVAGVGVRWHHDRERLVTAARRSAALTHAHPIGVDAAVVQALAVATAAAAGAFGPADVAGLAGRAATEELRAGLVAAAGADDLDAARALGSDVVAHRSVPAALWCAAAADGVAEAVARAVALGGDVDTVAAMACAVRGAADGVAALPAARVVACEGHERAARLGRRLGAVAAGPSDPSGG